MNCPRNRVNSTVAFRGSARLLVVLAIAVTAPAGRATAEEAQTLTGTFVWNRGNPGDLEAVFTPTGPERWNVAVRFIFGGRSRVFTGTAEGTLSSGGLQGRVRNGNRERTFSFTGTIEDGTFRGTHAEIGRDGQATATGTLTLHR